MSNIRAFHIAPILPCRDLVASIKFYTEVLGWNLRFKWPESDDAVYAGVENGPCYIHLKKTNDDFTTGGAYVFLRGVAEYAEQVKSRGGVPAADTQTTEYAMTEFCIRDPDGHLITFGQGHE